jgi:hypothetical protein
VGGRARIDAAGKHSQGKAIWVIGGNDTLIENVELSGCRVPDKNGAGIRFEGRNLTLRYCYFHDNEEGILAADVAGSEMLIEYSEFARNAAGDGYSHNLYIDGGSRFTLRYCDVHHAREGHNVKSRAEENFIEYNRIMDEADGTSSYLIDLPNAGAAFLIGNVLQQGPLSPNTALVAYGAEGATNSSSNLFVINNTFVNDLGDGRFIEMFDVDTPAVLKNNIFCGGGTINTQSNDIESGNWEGDDPMLVDRAKYDYRLMSGSPCVDAGVDPDVAPERNVPLTPFFQYVQPSRSEPRVTRGWAIDIGAYELGAGGGA